MVKMRKGFLAGLFALALVVGLCPAMAFAATGDGGDLQATSPQLGAQADNDLKDAQVRWTGGGFVGDKYAQYQFFYVKGKNKPANPQFDVYLAGKKVDSSKYTVSYELTWWDDEEDEDVSKPVSASKLTPYNKGVSGTEEDMSSEYRLQITANEGSGYTGSYTDAVAVVVDWYNVGRNMDCHLTKADRSWKYNINPMNGNYYVIPQAKVKSTLNSLRLMAGCTPADGGMNHDGTTVASKYYSVTYYKAKKDAVDQNLSPASGAIVGKALKSQPTAAGSYVMVIKGKSPYYGSHSILFDIQGSMSDVKVAAIPAMKENGKYREPGVKVTYKGETLVEGVDYDVTYKKNLKAGTATATITGTDVLTNDHGYSYEVDKPRFFTGSKILKFTVKKNTKKTWQNNTMKVTPKALKAKVKSLQSRGDKTFTRAQAFNLTGAKGKVTFTKVSGPSLISVTKSGKVTVNRHAGMIGGGTFKAKVKVLAAGDSTHYALAKTVTLTVKVA